MSILSWVVLVGFVAVLLFLDALRKEVQNIPSADNEIEIENLNRRLDSIQDTLDNIENHTGRLAEPLYDQDELDRENMTGKYAPPI